MKISKCNSCSKKRRKKFFKKAIVLSAYFLSSAKYLKVQSIILCLTIFLCNKLFTLSQSVLLPGDSCIGKILSIIHEAQTNFDSYPPVHVRGVLLDISKAFGAKSFCTGSEGELLSLI